MEQLSLQNPEVELSGARRAWHEAHSAWPGEEHQMWWKWLSEAARSIGLITKTVDCTYAECIELVSDGIQLFTHVSGERESWLGIRKIGSHEFQIMKAEQHGSTHNASLRKVKSELRRFEVNGVIRCVTIRGDFSTGGETHSPANPLSRLLTLMKPEWSDIWIVVVFAFTVGLLTLATPIAVESLVNTVAFGRFMQPIVVLALILLIFLTFSAAMRALQTYVVEIVQRRLFVRVAGDLAFRLPRVAAAQSDTTSLPELTNRFFDIVTVQKVTAQLLLDGVGLILSAVIGMAVLAFYHPWLLGFDIVMMASIAFIILVLGRGAVYSAIKESKHKYNMAAWLEDIGHSPTTFRTSGGSELALERADRLIHEYLQAREKHFHILIRQIIFALGLQAVASTALLGLGGWLVINGQLTLGQLVAAELIVTVIVGAFAKLGKHMESYYDLLASVDKLGTLFDLPTERHDGILEMGATGPAHVEACAVRCKNAFGEYPRNGMTFSVAPGESVALVGPAGSGKSMLMDLIYGLRTPSSGHVTIDGFDPQDLRADVLRVHVALARGPEVFNGSLEENVHLHRPGVTASDVRSALETVGLYDTVLQLPDGFDTVLASGGAPLSGTQRQLLTIARAIAGRPRLLLLDGILEGLPEDDAESVLKRLLHPDRRWTVIITTGQRSLANLCQRIVYLPVGENQEASKLTKELPQ